MTTNHILTIHGYEEHFAINPDVKILRNGILLGEVGHHRTIQVEVDEDCDLEFKSGIRSTRIRVRKDIDTHILLAFDRFTGSLKAIATNDHNLSELQRMKTANAQNAVLRSALLILALAGLWFFVRGLS